MTFQSRPLLTFPRLFYNISDDLCNPQAAERFYKAVNEKLKMLQEQPYMFPVSQDEKLRADGYRFTVVGKFMIFYLVDNEKETVSIARVLYGKRDIPSLL